MTAPPAPRRDRASGVPQPPGLHGDTAPIRELVEQVERLARGEAPVLLTGEPGTEKRRVAAYVHARGARAARPFVTLACTVSSGGLATMHLARAGVGVREASPGMPELFSVAPERVVETCVASALALARR